MLYGVKYVLWKQEFEKIFRWLASENLSQWAISQQLTIFGILNKLSEEVTVAKITSTRRQQCPFSEM